MSMQDEKWTFSDAQAITSIGDTESSDTVDVGRATPPLGAGTPVWCNVKVATAFSSGGQATLEVRLETGAANTLGTILMQSREWAVAECVKGKVLMSIPVPAEDVLRHLGMQYEVGTSAMSAGNVDAWVGGSPINDV